MNLEGLKARYREKRREIRRRLAEFKKPKTDRELFAELAFCLLTPQCPAKRCAALVESLKENDELYLGNFAAIHKKLTGLRFHRNKARNILQTREMFAEGFEVLKKIREPREWLVKNVRGMGLKEAGHFLRNIGRGKNLAILDVHVLRNLKRYGVIPRVPKSLTRKTYFGIEMKMAGFAKRVGIPLAELDLLFWSEETGEIFK